MSAPRPPGPRSSDSPRLAPVLYRLLPGWPGYALPGAPPGAPCPACPSEPRRAVPAHQLHPAYRPGRDTNKFSGRRASRPHKSSPLHSQHSKAYIPPG
ncbi:hypothetical protein NDU88_003350 [Pleurodeles waltl]|uniref:Uncharacterized protein n=1 Tax=Pleurodeles waltl TaxID=8319 RepID=A0AAV7PGN4_PLEWA|nr:hypothetical protein NDU88_003350 [Pleurodeles waltl]